MRRKIHYGHGIHGTTRKNAIAETVMRKAAEAVTADDQIEATAEPGCFFSTNIFPCCSVDSVANIFSPHSSLLTHPHSQAAAVAVRSADLDG